MWLACGLDKRYTKGDLLVAVVFHQLAVARLKDVQWHRHAREQNGA
jgi:hypothetical protein